MNEYLENIIDSANEGIYVTDPNRRFLLWNEAAETISGFSKNEIIGRSCFNNILSHTDAEGNELCFVRCPLQAAIDDGKPRGPDIVFLRHKTGKRIAVEVRTAAIRNEKGDIIGGVEVFQDVTERLERERLLRERKEKLETVLDSIGDGILFLDTAGNISASNRSCAIMFGLDRSASGSSLASMPENAPLRLMLSRVNDAFRQSAAGGPAENAARCPEGKAQFRCWTAAMTTDHTPHAPRSRCFTCPVYETTRAFLEKPRELLHGDRAITVVSSFIEQQETNNLWEVIVFHDVTAEKLDAALKVAGAAAHELRQPLQVITMLAGMLERDLHGNDAVHKQLKSIVASCDRMDGIIERMTAITKYKTRDYVSGMKIFDISRSSDKH